MYLCKFYWFQVQRRETLFWTFQSAGVTLKTRSRSPQSNQLFRRLRTETIFWTFHSAGVTLKIRPRPQLISSQQFINASLVKIHLLVHMLTQESHILDILKCRRELGNKVKVTKIYSTLPLLLPMYLCKIGENPSTGSEDNAWK